MSLSNVRWSDKVPEREGTKSTINGVAISPDGTRVIVAVEKRVLLYNAETGDMMESLKGHKDNVYCVDFSSDGSRFASGGADNVVVIWKTTPQGGQGVLKYTHSAPIQQVKYNPVSVQLASCSDGDFGLWMPDQKQVVKEKVASRILAASWSSDGTLLALGLLSGIVSVRNQKTEEVHRIERKAPVWCLAFVPNTLTKTPSTPGSSEGDLLAVGCWDKTLTLYKFDAKANPKAQTERSLRYYPCSLSLAGGGGTKSHFMVIAGSNKKVTLYSKEGIRLTELAVKDSWVWSAACQPGSDKVVLGTDTGAIDVLHMRFDAVHALFKEKYAYRENLTDIVIHQLIVDRKVRIKCKDLIQRISLYKNKLAVQLSDKVCVYESSAEEVTDMHFKARAERMAISEQQCDQMAVTSLHLLFSRANILELYSFDGQRQRIWQLEAAVSYIKVQGGPEGREGVLLGLVNGIVAKIHVDNPFPLELANLSNSIFRADLSLYKTKLATVDSKNALIVTDLKSHESLVTIQGVLSACFNSEVDDMLCYSTETSIFVISGLGSVKSPEPQEQHTSGLVVGFQGHKIFCLHKGTIMSIDVPQGANIRRALDNGDIQGAYRSACLGATEADWRVLAMRSLRANSLTVAKCAFARLKDTKCLSLIEQIERGPVSTQRDFDRRGGSSGGESSMGLDLTWQAELLAYEGYHQDAAKMYARAGKPDEAIRLYTDLRKWSEAKMFAQNAGQTDVSHLTMQQAKWLQEVNDWRGASELFLSMGQHMQAAKIIVDASEPGWQAVLIEVVRSTPPEIVDVITFCGEAFVKADEDDFGRESYEKVGDISKLMALYAKRQMWNEASKLADQHEGMFDVTVFLPYAEWLVSQDRYEEAMDAYKKAGRRDLSRKVLEELTFNAVSESRFKDASYYYWMLSKDPDVTNPAAHAECERKADLYFAYSTVHAYVTDPFTSHQPETLFQVSRFIINSLGNAEVIPHGISKASTLYTLARQAMTLGVYKLARHAYDRLGKLQMSQIPPKRQAEVEVDMLVIQAKPVRDDTDHLPVCYRCSATNPPLNPFTNKFAKGDVCTNCGHPFVRSFINFDVLPLVEFVPEPSISDEEAIELIRRQPTEGSGGRRSGAPGKKGGDTAGRWRESKDGDSDMLALDSLAAYDDTMAGGGGGNDPFARCLNIALESQVRLLSLGFSLDLSLALSLSRSH